MIATPDQSPFGSHAPGRLDRAVLAATRSLPHNWLGLRLAILLRRIVTMRPRAGFDVELSGLRLHPVGNGCEKNALFTPQMYDVGAAEAVAVRCRPLLAILNDAGVTTIDALKIDVKGEEDLALVPFRRDAPASLLPALVLIEDTSGYRHADVVALLAQHGYTVFARSRHNLALRQG